MDGVARDDRAVKDQAARMVAVMFGLLRHFAVEDDQLIADLPLRQLRVCGILNSGPQSMSAAQSRPERVAQRVDADRRSVGAGGTGRSRGRGERSADSPLATDFAGRGHHAAARDRPRGEDRLDPGDAARHEAEEVLGAFETLLDACLKLQEEDGRAVPAKAVV